MLKKFGEFINENVFDDMLSRSKGDGERNEDNINHFDINDFYKYLKNTYKSLCQDAVIEYQNHAFSGKVIYFPLFYAGNKSYKSPLGLYSGTISYDKENDYEITSIAISDDLLDMFPKLKDILENKFKIWCRAGVGAFIYPKDGVYSNTCCIDVIDTILSNVDKPAVRKIS